MSDTCRNRTFITTCRRRDLCVYRALHLWGVLLIPRLWRCCEALWGLSHQPSFSNCDLEQIQLLGQRKSKGKQISTTVFFFSLLLFSKNILTEGKCFFSVSFSRLLKTSCLLSLHAVASFWNWRRVITATESADRSETTGTCCYIVVLCTG